MSAAHSLIACSRLLVKNLFDAATPGTLIAKSNFYGQHGYVPDVQDLRSNTNMRATFLAGGADIKRGAVAGRMREHVWPLIEGGMRKPLIFTSFPLAQASEAHKLMESPQHIGTSVLTV